ncbi:MAG: type II toxin-antitoxin system Phd/YefM family antitoxin [Betaproteobacteria bacterium]|nr:type II toxin-antitoxin system Phd/YefM family antitoxin [Betaproteobacteria bacterium]
MAISSGSSMNDAYSIAAAKNNLSGLVHEAEQGHAVRLTRRGKLVAVLISTEQYERLSKPRKTIEWSAAVINTKNFKFDRDEANER